MERETEESKKTRVRLGQEIKNLIAETSVHRRILRTINNAVRPEDLLAPEPAIPHAEVAGFALGTPAGDDHGEPIDKKAEEKRKREQAAQLKFASEILKFRDENYPLGLRHVGELEAGELLDNRRFPELFLHLTHLTMGQWADFPVDIPRRGNMSRDGVIHAAMCHTGKVLFITADETTLLWDPNNTAASTFEDPTNQPHLMPSGYSQLCGHHVFLSSGKLLSVGGGGYGYNSLARAGYVFDPPSKTWARTSNNMSEAKWYPTAVAMGDERVLVTCGDRGGDMDIYDEATDTFSTATGDDRNFPNLYPGLHLLPSHSVFFSRTGWGDAGTGGSPTNDPQSAYFSFSGPNAGAWNNIQNASANRTKGMSVLLLSSSPPYVRIMVIGGVGGDRGTYEIADVTSLSGATSWSAPTPFLDGIDRSLASAVLLPNGNVFVAGGTTTTNSPCSIYNPSTGEWSVLAELPSVRHYHSVAILLPSGQVMMAGWENTKIEIFSPPYMFSARPTISSAPSLVHHGRTFAISSPEAETITKVVLVRPMAVTHQTDSEQKVIEMANRHDHANPSQILVTAPDGLHPHSNAQTGYYMMFAVNAQDVPSEAKWIYLH
jgi:hypothetical protein